MPHKKKKKPHRCKNHPRVTARGKCATCGMWICQDCAVLKRGEFYCKDTCAPGRAKKPLSKQPESPRAGVTEPPKRGAHVMFWTGATIALFGLAGFLFGLRQMQDNRRLRERIAGLENDRSRAIELLREKMVRIEELKSQIAQPNSPKVEEAPGEPPKRVAPPSPSGANPETGLPLNFDNGALDKKLVALTFDGGSYANAASDILDTLQSRSVTATMFLTGRFMERNAELVRRFVATGHEIGNHTYSHPHLTSWAQDHTHTSLPQVTEQYLCSELQRAAASFKKVTGKDLSPIWRAPYGEINGHLCRWAQRCGYLHIGWRQGRRWRENLDSNDWIPDEDEPGYHSPQEVYDKVVGLARSEPSGINGGIVLMHLGTQRKDPGTQVHRILGSMIDELRKMGYEFVTVSELLRESGIDISILAPGVRPLVNGRAQDMQWDGNEGE